MIEIYTRIISFQALDMLVVLEPSGFLVIYSGITKVGLHFNMVSQDFSKVILVIFLNFKTVSIYTF